MIRENAWTKYTKKDLTALEKLSKDYKDFLDNGRPSANARIYLLKWLKRAVTSIWMMLSRRD